VLYLERDTTCSSRDDGFAFVEGFGDFYLKAFAGRQLESDVGSAKEGVKELVGRRKAHQDYVGEKVGVGGFKKGDG